MKKNNKTKKLKETLNIFINTRFPFTALDISNYLKRSGFWIKHKEVAFFLNKDFESNGFPITYKIYKLDVVVKNEIKTTNLYYHEKINPETYSMIDQKSISFENFKLNYENKNQ